MCLFHLVVVFLLLWIFFVDKDDDEVVQVVWFGLVIVFVAVLNSFFSVVEDIYVP